MKVYMKKKDLIEVHEVMNELNGSYNKLFAYFLIKNKKILEPEIKSIVSVGQPAPEYAEFEEKRNDIIQRYCARDESGLPILKDNRWVQLKKEDFGVANEEILELEKENLDIIDQRNKDIKDFETLLNSEITIDVETISFEYLPEEISVRALEQLMSFVEKNDD